MSYFIDNPESDEKLARRINMIEKGINRALLSKQPKTTTQDHAMMAESDSAQENDEDTGSLLVDSGCTCTIMKDIRMFDEYQPSTRTVASAVGTAKMKAEGEGSVSLPVQTIDGTTILLKVAALHCPETQPAIAVWSTGRRMDRNVEGQRRVTYQPSWRRGEARLRQRTNTMTITVYDATNDASRQQPDYDKERIVAPTVSALRQQWRCGF
jgi:hypothetical protein